jgi:hypothetical protein
MLLLIRVLLRERLIVSAVQHRELSGAIMKNQTRAVASVIVSFCLVLSFGSFAKTQTHRSPVPKPNQKESPVTRHASGTFEVKLIPQTAESKMGDSNIGRFSIDKLFSGDLEGTSKGQMMAVGTEVEGSAGYVAMERVTGTLDGHSGSFYLQHSGTMTRGAQQLSVTVVPDSGTGDLAGLGGKMNITIVDGKHLYDFEYRLAKQQ